MSPDSFKKLVLFGSLQFDINAHFLSFGPDAVEKLTGIGSVGRVDLEHALDNLGQLLREVISDFGVLAFDNFFVESVHVLSSEGRFQSDHLVDNAAQTPDI